MDTHYPWKHQASIFTVQSPRGASTWWWVRRNNRSPLHPLLSTPELQQILNVGSKKDQENNRHLKNAVARMRHYRSWKEDTETIALLTSITISSTERNRINASISDTTSVGFVFKNTDKRVGSWSWDAIVIICKANCVGVPDTSWNVTTIASISLIANMSNSAVTVKIAVWMSEKKRKTSEGGGWVKFSKNVLKRVLVIYRTSFALPQFIEIPFLIPSEIQPSEVAPRIVAIIKLGLATSNTTWNIFETISFEAEKSAPHNQNLFIV